MAILPGSLDYLYHNGIVNSIPYDAYAMTPVTPSGMAQMAGMGMGFNYNQSMGAMHSPMSVGYPQMNGSQYLQAAQTGMLYNTYTHPDIFVKSHFIIYFLLSLIVILSYFYILFNRFYKK